MNEYHSLLQRQLNRAGINLDNDEIPENYLKLFQHISNAYNEAEQGRYIIERSMEISSQEMIQLREFLQKEKEIVQSVMSEGLCVIDPFWRISNLNVTGGNLLCCSPQTVIGKNFYDVFALYDTQNDQPVEINLEQLRIKCKQGEIYHCEKGLIKTFHGVSHTISFSINPLPLVNNLLFGGAVIILRDITKRLEAERVLKQSLKAESASNKAKTQFLANMSHEIRTPMNGILGMLQLLMHTPLNEQQKNYTVKCFDSANSLLRIIGDILDFSKIEAGKVDIEEIEFDIRNEFDSMMIMFTTMCKEKSLNIKLQYDDSIPRIVKGDPFRMKQIINNIVNNAIKFTPKNGNINISAKTFDRKDNFIYLDIEISDTGIGIPQEMQSKIFDVFSQADETTTRKYGGTGLGLAICKHLVEHMGGQINLKSEEGKGSTFSFTIKLNVSENQSQKIQSPVFTLPITPKFNANILLVEDNDLNQIVVNDMLKTLGCHIDIAETGKCAIEAFQKQKYDIIFMDCHMPDMDGFKATEKIREIEKEKYPTDDNKSIIVALTANTLKGTKDRCLAVGMDDYLSKPINYSQLCCTLIKHLPAAYSKDN